MCYRWDLIPVGMKSSYFDNAVELNLRLMDEDTFTKDDFLG